MNLPFLSIVMPVRNEEQHIAEVLNQLIEQDYPPDRLEILVVDGRSADHTREIVAEYSKSHPCIRLLDNPKFLSSAARNLGAKQAKGEIIVYIDGHCLIPDKNLLKNTVSCFEKSGADCLGRSQPLVLSDDKITQAIALARASALGHNPKSFIYSDYEGFIDPASCGAMYKREVFQKVGLFDEEFDACEDIDFNLRVREEGLKCYISPGLTIQYYPRITISSFFRQMLRYGRGRFKLFLKYPDASFLFAALPVLYLLLVILSGVFTIFAPYLKKIVLLELFLYIAPVAISSMWLTLKTKMILFPLFILIFPTIHFGISLGFWANMLSDRKRG